MDDLSLLREISRVVKRFRSRMRFGALSRAPLDILRLEISTSDSRVSCDWIIRPIDKWDESQPPIVRARLQSQQVLHDALAMRKLIFRLFSEIRTTELRAFRFSPGGVQELVLAGTVRREDDVPNSVRSLAMRAHLSGLQFTQVDGTLLALPLDRGCYAGDACIRLSR